MGLQTGLVLGSGLGLWLDIRLWFRIVFSMCNLCMCYCIFLHFLCWLDWFCSCSFLLVPVQVIAWRIVSQMIYPVLCIEQKVEAYSLLHLLTSHMCAVYCRSC